MVDTPVISPRSPPAPAPAPSPPADTCRTPSGKPRRKPPPAALPLWEPATQTVFGEGPADARLMFVGEQPGDQEDLAGRPFVGPAGQMFDRALAEAGIDRDAAYVTNAVKHFKFEPRGKRRIHSKPDARRSSRVQVLAGPGAPRSAARRHRAARRHGRPRGARPRGDDQPRARPADSARWQYSGLVTVHPSYLLRLPDEESKRREYAAFVQDLRQAKSLLEAS